MGGGAVGGGAVGGGAVGGGAVGAGLGAAGAGWMAAARLVAARSMALAAARAVTAVLVRLRWGWLPIAAAGLGWLDRASFVPDFTLFARSGGRLLNGDLAAVYADPQVQAGPWELLVFTPLAALDRALPGWGQPGPEAGLGVLGAGHTLLAVLGPALVVVATMAGVGRLHRMAAGDRRWWPAARRQRAGCEALAGALVLLWGVAGQVVQTGHPAQGVVPVCWLAAGLLARRGRPVAAGALVAVAAGWETWGVLALPVLLLAPGLRQAAAAATVAVAGAVLSYLPFVLAGGFAMTRFRWPVAPGSLAVRLGADPATGFGWEWRAGQGAAALLACTAVALATRHTDHGAWLAPLAAVTGRLVPDPTLYAYYWVPVPVLALAGLVLVLARTAGRPEGPPARDLAAAAAVLAVCWWSATGWGRTWPGTLAVTVPFLLLAAAVVHRARPRPGTPR